MDTAAARARLERMVAAGETPTLTKGDVDDLMAMAQRPDADGLTVDSDGWTPTYDLAAAAAEGWRWKAAKAAAQVDFSADGASVSMSKLRDACIAMAEQYEGKGDTGAGGGGIGTMTVGTSSSIDAELAALERQAFNLS